MSKDIKKALEHCVEWNCDNCPNREELGSGEIVCRGRLLPEVLEYVADLEAKLSECEEKCKKAYQEGLLQKQFDKDMEIEQLKQQLAEKDKEIEYQESMKILAVENKNEKAIEQLEKVKEHNDNLVCDKESRMRKFLIETYDIERNSIAVVEAETLQGAFVEFIYYYGIRYPLKRKDIENLVKDWTLEKFIEYFENEYNSIKQIYEIKEILYIKQFNIG